MSETSWIVVGASSAMARAFARRMATGGARLLLAGRDLEDIGRTAADCRVRGAAAAEASAWDARSGEGTEAILSWAEACPGPVGVAVFVGSMPEQAAVDADPALIAATVTDNFAGPAALLHRLAPVLEARGGAVVGVGSVAGDRGRLSNYVYGSAKAGFHTYLAGLRNRLGRSGVQVMTVKPGFVDTAMTWGLPGLFLVAEPEAVAADIAKGLARGRNEIYTPWFWRWIMLVIRSIPETLFKKLKI